MGRPFSGRRAAGTRKSRSIVRRRVSRLFPRPGYQDGVPGITATRGVPDVSADASGHTGMTITLGDEGSTMIRDSGGTSASAPIWAALITLADQYAGRHLGLVDPAVYQITRSPRYD